MASATATAVPGPVNLNALGSDDFAFETAEMRFARRHGDASVPAGHDDPAAEVYGTQEAVWRPDGKGANETIYQPFYWKGRKVRALKPAQKTRPGEQWLFPERASNDHQIGILTGDARFIGNEPLVAPDNEARRRFNRFQALQRHNKNPGLGGAAEDGLYGLDEETAASGMRLDQVREALANGEGGNAAQARPVQFMRADIDRQILAELEKVNHDAKAMQFLLDPDANAEYNTLAMGAAVTAVNTTGDYNLGVDGNLLLDRGTLYLTRPGETVDESAAPRAGAIAAQSDTLNAVKVRTADMHGINNWGAHDGTHMDIDGEDANTSSLLTHSKDQAQTTHVLFNRSSRGPEVGLNGEADMDAENAPLSAPRRYRRKEQDRGFVQAATASEDQDQRDSAPLTMSRRYRRKEQDQGAQHASMVSDRDVDGADRAPLAMPRRYRRKEQDQGAQHASLVSDRDVDGADQAPLSMSRRYRRKEQDQGAQHASMVSDRDVDGADKAPLSMSRRYRRKEVDRVDEWSGVVGMDMGDIPHRELAAPRKREASTVRAMSAALQPGAGYDNAGEVMGRESRVISQVPSQEARGVERAAGRKMFGLGVLKTTESDQFLAQNRIDPLVPETLSRSAQTVNLRDRRAQQTQISVRGYDEISALQATYAHENRWMERGRGKLGQPVFYESADESGADSGAE